MNRWAQDIRNWEVVKQAFAYEDLDDDDWEEIVEIAGVDDPDSIGIDEFEDILDVLFERMSSADDDDENDES